MLWARFALQTLAYLWPAYQTFKALEGDNRNIEETKKWVHYWVIIGMFTAVQPLLDTFLFWMPLYYEAKLAFVLYLWYPALQGAGKVYSRWLQPTLLQQEPLIDQRMAEAKARLGDLLTTWLGRLVALAQEKAGVLLQAAQQQAQARANNGSKKD